MDDGREGRRKSRIEGREMKEVERGQGRNSLKNDTERQHSIGPPALFVSPSFPSTALLRDNGPSLLDSRSRTCDRTRAAGFTGCRAEFGWHIFSLNMVNWACAAWCKREVTGGNSFFLHPRISFTAVSLYILPFSLLPVQSYAFMKELQRTLC